MGSTLTEDIGSTRMSNHTMEKRVTCGTERKICDPSTKGEGCSNSIASPLFITY